MTFSSLRECNDSHSPEIESNQGSTYFLILLTLHCIVSLLHK